MKGSDELGLIHPFSAFWGGTGKRPLRRPRTSGMNNTACLPLHRPQGCPLRRWPGHKATSLERPGQKGKPTRVGRVCVLPPHSQAPASFPLSVRSHHGDFLSPVRRDSIRANGRQVQIRVSKQGQLSGRLPPSTASISPVPVPTEDEAGGGGSPLYI